MWWSWWIVLFEQGLWKGMDCCKRQHVVLIAVGGALHVPLSLFFPCNFMSIIVNLCILTHGAMCWSYGIVQYERDLWKWMDHCERHDVGVGLSCWSSACLMSLLSLSCMWIWHITHDTNLPKLMDCALTERGSWKEIVVRNKMWWWSQLVEYYMSRIWHHNGEVNAVVESCAPPSALTPPCHQASPRVLEGLPFLVKGKQFVNCGLLWLWFFCINLFVQVLPLALQFLLGYILAFTSCKFASQNGANDLEKLFVYMVSWQDTIHVKQPRQTFEVSILCVQTLCMLHFSLQFSYVM